MTPGTKFCLFVIAALVLVIYLQGEGVDVVGQVSGLFSTVVAVVSGQEMAGGVSAGGWVLLLVMLSIFFIASGSMSKGGGGK